MIGSLYDRYLRAAEAGWPLFVPQRACVPWRSRIARICAPINPEETYSGLYANQVSGGTRIARGMARLLGIILASKSSSGSDGHAADRFCETSLDIGGGLMFSLNIKPFYIAAHAAWETGWGTSRIFRDKNNAFSYGAFDRCPYDCALSFDTVQEGVEFSMGSVKANYLTPGGTFYNGSTLAGMNVRYATDSELDLWNRRDYELVVGCRGGQLVASL